MSAPIALAEVAMKTKVLIKLIEIEKQEII